MAFNLPDFKDFVLPYGAGTQGNYAGTAATAYGNMIGAIANASRPSDALSPQTAAEQAKGQIGAARYGAIGGVGTNYSNNYGAYSQALGQMGSNAASQYGVYGNLLGGLGNAAAGSFGAFSQAVPQMRAADANAYGAYSNSLGNAYGDYSNSLAAGYGAYGNTLSNMAGARSNNLSAFSSGLGTLSQSMANERGALANANAIAESARQGSLGNIGAAALGAFGSAANSALAAWSANQSAYNKSLADMSLANQNAVSQFGQSRNNALGTLGSAYGTTAAGSAPAAAVGDVTASFGGSGGGGGSGFSADVGGGNLATGSFGGDLLGGLTGSVSRTSNAQGAENIAGAAFSGLDRTRGDVMDNSVLRDLSDGAMRDGSRLDLQHMTSRNMPFTALDGILSGIRGLGSDAYGESRMGMNQFYGNAPAGTDYGSLLGLLNRRTEESDAGVDRFAADATTGFSSFRDDLGNRFGSTQAGLGAGLGAYNAGSLGSMAALAGGYGGAMGALGGAADAGRYGFDSSLAAQAGLASSAGGGFNTANRYTDSVFDHLQPEKTVMPPSQPAIDPSGVANGLAFWRQNYPDIQQKPERTALARKMEEDDRRRAAEAQQTQELMAQGWTWHGNTGGWRPPPNTQSRIPRKVNPVPVLSPAATYVPQSRPTGPVIPAPGRTVY